MAQRAMLVASFWFMSCIGNATSIPDAAGTEDAGVSAGEDAGTQCLAGLGGHTSTEPRPAAERAGLRPRTDGGRAPNQVIEVTLG